jgi:flagellar biosynthesis protein FliQ
MFSQEAIRSGTSPAMIIVGAILLVVIVVGLIVSRD